MKAIKIEWNIDMDEVYEKLDGMTSEKASEVLGIPLNTYCNMTTSEKHDYAYDTFHHNLGMLYDFMGLPEEVELPETLKEAEDITYWLSDTYGFCIDTYDIIENESLDRGTLEQMVIDAIEWTVEVGNGQLTEDLLNAMKVTPSDLEKLGYDEENHPSLFAMVAEYEDRER